MDRGDKPNETPASQAEATRERRVPARLITIDSETQEQFNVASEYFQTSLMVTGFVDRAKIFEI